MTVIHHNGEGTLAPAGRPEEAVFVSYEITARDVVSRLKALTGEVREKKVSEQVGARAHVARLPEWLRTATWPEAVLTLEDGSRMPCAVAAVAAPDVAQWLPLTALGEITSE